MTASAMLESQGDTISLQDNPDENPFWICMKQFVNLSKVDSQTRSLYAFDRPADKACYRQCNHRVIYDHRESIESRKTKTCDHKGHGLGYPTGHVVTVRIWHYRSDFHHAISVWFPFAHRLVPVSSYLEGVLAA